MSSAENKLERTLALNNAAYNLGFDDTTRKALTHIESLVSVMSEAGLTWDDIPEVFSIESVLGEEALKTLCEQDPGLDLAVRAQYDPELRKSLLSRYVLCIEVARPGEVMSVQQTFQALLEHGLSDQ